MKAVVAEIPADHALRNLIKAGYGIEEALTLLEGLRDTGHIRYVRYGEDVSLQLLEEVDE